MRRHSRTFLLIFALFLLISCGKEDVRPPQETEIEREVKVETVKLSQEGEDYEAVGTLRSKMTSVLSSKIVGTIQSIHVREGDRIAAGQPLIEIDDRDIKAQLRKAEAGLREIHDALEEAEQLIRAGESAREMAEAQSVLAASTYQRYRALFEERSVSLQEFEEVQAKYRVAQADLERAISMLLSARAKKNQLHAKMDQAKADIAQAQIRLEYAKITSLIRGIVIARQAEVGTLAMPGVPLLTIEDDSRYRLEASVEESHIRKIRTGDSARVLVDALGEKIFSARVTEIVPVSDPASRTYTVKIDLPSNPLFRSGLYGKARFTIGEKQVLTVPRAAILQRGQLTGVYIVDGEQRTRFRLIKTGNPYGDRMEILSGVREGERIVVSNPGALSDGVRVQF